MSHVSSLVFSRPSCFQAMVFKHILGVELEDNIANIVSVYLELDTNGIEGYVCLKSELVLGV
jgi:hypothetical protein